MASNRTITAANSVYMLGVARLYPIPQQLQGYGADKAFDTDAAETAEVVKGVDGIMSAGFIPTITSQSIEIQADSPSSQIFEDWDSAQRAIKEIYFANGIIILPSVARQYVLVRGVLSSVMRVPGTRKVLQARTWIIKWDSISPVPYLGP